MEKSFCKFQGPVANMLGYAMSSDVKEAHGRACFIDLAGYQLSRFEGRGEGWAEVDDGNGAK